MTSPLARTGQPPDGSPRRDIGEVLRAVAGAGGQRPFLTFSDGASGERTELGHATFANWVAKAANLLTEELELLPGDRLGLHVPTSWTAVVIAAAAWRAGVAVDLDGWGDAAAVGEHVRSPADEPARLVVVGTGMGGRLTTDAGSAIAFAEEVLGFPDDYEDPDLEASTPALEAQGRTWTHGELIAEGGRRAARLGLDAGERFLSAVPTTTAEGLVAGPVTALAIAGGFVLVANTGTDRLDAIAEGERCRVVIPDD